MGVHIPIGYSQAVFKFSCQGVTDLMVVTFGIADDAAQPVNTVAQTLANMATSAVGKWLHPSAYTLRYSFVSVDVIRQTLVGHTIGTFAVNAVGTGNQDPLPANCAILVKKSTASGGRPGRGRFFIPPMHFTQSQIGPAGIIESTSLSSFQNKMNTWLTDMTASAFDMFLLHSNEALAPHPITSLSVANQIATQRRRMR